MELFLTRVCIFLLLFVISALFFSLLLSLLSSSSSLSLPLSLSSSLSLSLSLLSLLLSLFSLSLLSLSSLLFVGIADIVPMSDLFRLFTWRELQSMICGEPVIDIELLKSNTICKKF